MKKLTFCARFQTIVDLGAIKLLKKWNAEIKKKDVKCLQIICPFCVNLFTGQLKGRVDLEFLN